MKGRKGRDEVSSQTGTPAANLGPKHPKPVNVAAAVYYPVFCALVSYYIGRQKRKELYVTCQWRDYPVQVGDRVNQPACSIGHSFPNR